jgi:hypothetical protein
MKDKNCEKCSPKVPCPGTNPQEEQMKKMKEAYEKRTKPTECPHLSTCTKKVLENEVILYCKDQEKTQDAILLHVSGHHVFEICPEFLNKKREKEGKLPKEY